MCPTVSLQPEHDSDAIEEAARILKHGGLVAFPTETVYGLGASLAEPAAISAIFQAKGRPDSVPLIAHVLDWAQARPLVDGPISEAVLAMIRALWPGPLTLVVSKSAIVPDVATGGRGTVGIRAPNHPVAEALLRRLGEPIVAPSANRYGGVPPVTAQHVIDGLGGRIDAVLDGGRCPGGLESTVLDLTVVPARILRSGAVSLEKIERYLPVAPLGSQSGVSHSSASMNGQWLSVCSTSETLRQGAAEQNPRVVVLMCGRRSGGPSGARVLPGEPVGYAAGLYDMLHELRTAGVEHVWAEAPPMNPEWDGVWARLRRLVRGLDVQKASRPEHEK